MNKLFIAALSSTIILGSCSNKKNADTASESEISTDSVAGVFEVHEFDGYKLHIYLTEDEMADASFIIEGNDSLVTLEQPLFVVNANAFDSYLESLGKPVANRISDFHLGNTDSATLIVPEGMTDVFKGSEYSGMMAHFADAYGDAIEPLPTGTTEEVAFDSVAVLAGVPFTFLRGATNDFPGANILINNNVVYSHWAPTRSHINALYASNIAGIDSRIDELTRILATGATLFVGGHGNPATTDDVAFRIEYLNKIKALLSANDNADSFAEALISAYPGLPGQEGVSDFAKALYSSENQEGVQ